MLRLLATFDLRQSAGTMALKAAMQGCGKDWSTWLLWGPSAIGDGLTLLPLGNSLLVDSIALGERSQALLTILYRSTDRLCRGGAAV
jgi:hypothetical protein